jgi:hypothetical protein
VNIFILDIDPIDAAITQCDKHIVKMILESGQMLSTAHRVLDGEVSVTVKNGRKTKQYLLSDERDEALYKPAHVNHPCSIWCRESSANYEWLFLHFLALGEEYTSRYGKEHLTIQKLANHLWDAPDNIAQKNLTPFALAMPDEFKTDDPVESYRDYYCSKQASFNMVWTNRNVPAWFN